MRSEADRSWVPPVVDTERPNVARMYDYYLGGKDHFAVDRELAERTLAVIPELRDVALANRLFLQDAVRRLSRGGIDQFVDLGTGIPTSPSVHEVARHVNADASVVYVDHDPVVVAHNRALLQEDARIVTLGHDLADPTSVLDDPRLHDVIDLRRPVGLLLIAVLHFVDLALAPRIVARYARDLAPGSRVVITLASNDGIDPSVQQRVETLYSRASTFVYRTRAQFEELFGDLDIEPPGVVDLLRTPSLCGLAGVAVKR